MQRLPKFYLLFIPQTTFVLGLCLSLAGCLEEEENARGSQTVTPVALNDTGITRCADAESDVLNCPVVSHPAQDAEYGQDLDNSDDTNGRAGFSFTKLSDTGEPLPASESNWDCVQDNVTGLIWEIKADPALAAPSGDVLNPLQISTNTYTWYDPSRPLAGADRGVENGGNCLVIDSCDTQEYVAEINRIALCGFQDWRLPSRAELRSIVDYGVDQPGPTIDHVYFPSADNTDNIHGTHTDWYWSFQTSARFNQYAWAVGFNTGGDSQLNKHSSQAIRLVRSGL